MSDQADQEQATPADTWSNRRILFLVVVIALIFYAIFRLPTALSYVAGRARDILILLILSVALTYFLQPAVDGLVRIPLRIDKRVQRNIAAVLVIILFLALLLALVGVIVTPITRELGDVLQALTDWAQTDLSAKADAFVERTLSSLPEPYRSEARHQIEEFQQQLTGENIADTIRSRIAEWGGAVLDWYINIMSSVVSSGSYVIALLIVPVFAFYFLTDAGTIRAGMATHVPPEMRQRYHRMIEDVDEVIEAYVRTVMVISLMTGLATTLTLYFAGVDAFLTFGILAGVANMIPILGGIVAFVLIVAISLLTVGLKTTVIVALVYGAIQFVTDRIVAPKLMSEGANLHPVAVIVALMIGAEFFGMIGIFIAVPVLAAARVVYIHYRAFAAEEGHSRELDDLLGPRRGSQTAEPPPGQPPIQALTEQTGESPVDAGDAADEAEQSDTTDPAEDEA